MDVVRSFLVNGGMIVPKVPDTLGVSIAWLKCEIFCAVIESKRLVALVMDSVCPVEFWLESVTGTSTLWSDECTLLLHIFQFPKCGNGRLCCKNVIEGCFHRCIGNDGCVGGAFCEMIVSEVSC